MAAYQKRQQTIFSTIKSEGAILPMDLLQRISDPQNAQLAGLTPDDYHLSALKLNEAINRAWTSLLGIWQRFQNERMRLSAHETGTTLTRERWLLPLFNELGYGRLQTKPAIVVDERSYAISHGWERTPIYLVSYKVDLDRSIQSESGARRSSPHSLLQELLNRSQEHLWGIVSNGLKLRILRNNVSLTRQAYVEFDLEEMFNNEVYADFVLLWLLCHQSRVEFTERPANCWLEKWSQEAHANGTRALDALRENVEQAIKELGSGFLSHPANRQLHERLNTGTLSAMDYYNQLLRMVYRLLVLFVAEDRDILFDPAALPAARDLYRQYYSTAKLRAQADRQLGTRHSDLYYGLKLIMDKLGQEEGCPELGLPALNGFLFSSEAVRDLNDCQLANYALLAAVRHLGYTESGRTRRIIDYKNLGSEELGSVYESLLELHPIFHLDTGKFELASASGNARKTTGSYYTPTSLITCLLDSALDPVLDEAMNQSTAAEAEAAILNLKICDPSCGSGHFLTAAAHRIAKKLAAVRTGDEEPAPGERRKALRDVVSHCIYGVDINRMSVELCKVSLWMESIEPGKPLSFLDAHIQCGNSLLGATPTLLKKGIPDEAFEPIEGDDRKMCSKVKKLNKQFHAGNQTLRSGEERIFGYHRILGESIAHLDTIDNQDVQGVYRQQQEYNTHLQTIEYRHSKLWADSWCAAFVWKKRPGALYPFTQEDFRALEQDIDNIDIYQYKEIGRLAAQYQFFHWHLAFPQVFRVPGEGEVAENEQAGWSGGFDVVLGNPPWDSVEIDKDVSAEMKRRISAFQGFIGNSALYRLTNRGRRNLYALFAEMILHLIDRNGKIGVILPTGIVTDKPNEELCKHIVKKEMISELLDFENHGLFPAVDDRYRFCLLTISANEHVKRPAYGFMLRDVADRHIQDKIWSISAEEVERLSPTKFSIPCFSSPMDAEVIKKIYRAGTTLSAIQQRYTGSISSALMLNFDSKSKAIKKDTSDILLREDNNNEFERMWSKVYEGEYFHAFDHRYATCQNNAVRYVSSQEKTKPHRGILTAFVVGKNDCVQRWQQVGRKDTDWYIGLRRQTRISDEISSIAAILPASLAEGSVSCFFGSKMDGMLTALLCSNLNSYIFNYVVRIRQNGPNLSKSIYEQIPLCKTLEEALNSSVRNGNNTVQQQIMSRVLELTYTSWDLQSFAQACGYNGNPFIWDEERRFLLRCELDAMYFHLYGIARDEVKYIMETFPILKRKEEKQYGEYRTKRVILEIYDEMQAAMVSGGAYHTWLTPGPADPAVAHQPR